MRKLPVLLFCLLSTSAGLFANDFAEVDNIISSGISNAAFPGAQLIVGNEEGIVYEKCYGNFTYDESSPTVTKDCMFDLASVTKVVATTTAIMQLYDRNMIDIHARVSDFIPEFANNGKEDITILNLLLHNSGLKAFVPFYQTMSSREEVLNYIYNIDLEYGTGTKTVYSDLNAILLGIIVERVSGMKLDEYCRKNIFEALGMNNTTFVPGEELKSKILPTENDTYWRHRLLQGEVHDESASLLGGVSGNAGLFSNAEDLYKFMRMMLNKGDYYNPYSRGLKEEKFFDAFTVNKFTTRYSDVPYENSRALGWDTKPVQKSANRIPCGELISENCFGHTGFTGTSVWCDRDRILIIIFLTNRIYPSRDNHGISEVRPDVYNASIRCAAGTGQQ